MNCRRTLASDSSCSFYPKAKMTFLLILFPLVLGQSFRFQWNRSRIWVLHVSKLSGSPFRWNSCVSVAWQSLSSEGNGPRIRIPHIELPLTASTHLAVRILAGNVLLAQWQTYKQTNLFNFVRPSFQSREWPKRTNSNYFVFRIYHTLLADGLGYVLSRFLFSLRDQAVWQKSWLPSQSNIEI